MAGLIPIPITPEQLRQYEELGIALYKVGKLSVQAIVKIFHQDIGLDKETVAQLTPKWQALADDVHRSAGL